MLLTPEVELPKEYQVPRDMVLVLDTSGSMRGVKMEQARKALKYCLENLGAERPLRADELRHHGQPVSATTCWTSSSDHVDQAKKWVAKLEATGGTAINDALAAALGYRSDDPGRSFTIVFFTDGQPTIGETNPDKILTNIQAKNTANTRIFTFGVGDDVNATFLDAIADKTRALTTYVRPAEDIEAKVSGLYSKISNPVLTNLKLSATNDISFNEIYPPQLPDLFHGSQLVVLGRYNGKGPAAIKLTGMVGKEKKEFVYEVTFPDEDERRPRLRRAVVGAAQGRLHARPDPGQRREEGAGRRGDGAGEEVRHHHAVHQLPDRAGRRRAGGAGPDAGRQAERELQRPGSARVGPGPGVRRLRRRRCRGQADFGGGVCQAEPGEARRSGGQPRRLRRP